MGRQVICPHCKSVVDEDILKQRNSENTCLICGKSLLGDSDSSKGMESEEQSDWITWYYYKDPKYGDYSLWDKLPLRPEELELIQEFKAPPRDSSGSSERAKEILRTYVPDAFVYSKDSGYTVKCPRCGSKEFTLLNRGYSIFTGFLGSGRVKRVCNRCKKEF